MALLSTYLTRGDSLRATVSAGSPLPLGFMLAMGFGLWLHIGWQFQSKLVRWGGVALFWFGLLAAYSRGPWMAGAAVYVVFNAFSPRPVTKLMKAAAAAMITAMIVAMTPLADKILSVLPFTGGQVDTYNVIYRQRLFARCLEVIGESPWLGAPDGYLKLADMRQAQGIVDLVNTYMQIMLNNGILGLGLFLGFILTALYRAWRAGRMLRKLNPEISSLGPALAACIVGTLLMLADGSFGNGVEKAFYMLGALSSAYAYLLVSGKVGLVASAPAAIDPAPPRRTPGNNNVTGRTRVLR
jgi:O-antigen ligase